MATNASGNLRVCCNSTPGKNYVTRPNGRPYKISDPDASDYWNSPVLTNIREQFLAGKRPEMCERCFREEDAGIRSARQSWNSSWYQEQDYSAIAEPHIKYFDIRLGNLCNLKCRMCNPFASNQWIDEWNLVERALPVEEAERLKKMDWFEGDQTWDNIFKYAEYIEEIYLTGGEPTLAISQYRLFDRLIEAGLARKIRLKYNTNMTNIPQKMVDYWQHFKRIKINASIDAVGDLNRYIRYPTAWSSVEKNLKIFKQMRDEDRCNLQVHVTVQVYNVLYLDKLFDYLYDLDITDIYLNILNHPRYLNIRCLPEHLKKQVNDTLCKYKHINKVQGVIDYMYAEDWSEYIPELIDYTCKLDQSRKQDCTEAAPEIGELVYGKLA
jgi:sulfatase maturation enzyme AslB (radical SAM superfamily)